MKEKQYERIISIKREQGFARLGLMSNQVWVEDPKRMVFYLSRYKFVSRMLEGFDSVLEVGCGDAFASRIVSRSVKKLTVSDFDSEFLSDISDRLGNQVDFELLQYNPCESSTPTLYNAIYALDVIEHISEEMENTFLSNLESSLLTNGLLIIGTPSLESQPYASIQSKEGHVNCKSAVDWKNTLKKVFPVVLQFGMNDEVLHTGFDKMCHYLFFVCIK